MGTALLTLMFHIFLKIDIKVIPLDAQSIEAL
jgi:hypothetical protein